MKHPICDVIQYGERKVASPVRQAFTFLVTFNVQDSVVSQLHEWPGVTDSARRASVWQRGPTNASSGSQLRLASHMLWRPAYIVVRSRDSSFDLHWSSVWVTYVSLRCCSHLRAGRWSRQRRGHSSPSVTHAFYGPPEALGFWPVHPSVQAYVCVCGGVLSPACQWLLVQLTWKSSWWSTTVIEFVWRPSWGCDSSQSDTVALTLFLTTSAFIALHTTNRRWCFLSSFAHLFFVLQVGCAHQRQVSTSGVFTLH